MTNDSRKILNFNDSYVLKIDFYSNTPVILHSSNLIKSEIIILDSTIYINSDFIIENIRIKTILNVKNQVFESINAKTIIFKNCDFDQNIHEKLSQIKLFNFENIELLILDNLKMNSLIKNDKTTFNFLSLKKNENLNISNILISNINNIEIFTIYYSKIIFITNITLLNMTQSTFLIIESFKYEIFLSSIYFSNIKNLKKSLIILTNGGLLNLYIDKIIFFNMFFESEDLFKLISEQKGFILCKINDLFLKNSLFIKKSSFLVIIVFDIQFIQKSNINFENNILMNNILVESNFLLINARSITNLSDFKIKNSYFSQNKLLNKSEIINYNSNNANFTMTNNIFEKNLGEENSVILKIRRTKNFTIIKSLFIEILITILDLYNAKIYDYGSFFLYSNIPIIAKVTYESLLNLNFSIFTVIQNNYNSALFYIKNSNFIVFFVCINKINTDLLINIEGQSQMSINNSNFTDIYVNKYFFYSYNYFDNNGLFLQNIYINNLNGNNSVLFLCYFCYVTFNNISIINSSTNLIDLKYSEINFIYFIIYNHSISNFLFMIQESNFIISESLFYLIQNDVENLFTIKKSNILLSYLICEKNIIINEYFKIFNSLIEIHSFSLHLSYSLNIKICILFNSKVLINETKLINDKKNITISYLELLDRNNLTINNSIFLGASSCNGSVINSKSNKLTQYENTIDITSTIFYNNKAEMSGGALYINHFQLILKNSSFIKNFASNGGSIYINYSKNQKKYSSQIINSKFINNQAISGGGAIYWIELNPILLNTTFFKNIALFGLNLASQPMKIILLNNSLPILNSGIQYSNLTLVFAIVDFYNQRINDLSSGYSTMFLTHNPLFDQHIIGIDSIPITNGFLLYNNFGIVYKPNSTAIIFLTTTVIDFFSINLVNMTQHLNIMGSYYFSFEMFVRGCIKGEINNKLENKCNKCKINFFSLNTSDLICHSCVPFASCLGGNILNIYPGYWRKSEDSSKIYRCLVLKQGCQGGIGTGTELCNEGYEGALCGVCAYNNEKKYFLNALGRCVTCQNFSLAYVFIIFLVSSLIFGVLVYFSVHESYKYASSGGRFCSNVSILINLIINYLQILSIVSNIEIKWPSVFSSSNSVGVFNDFSNIVGILHCPLSEISLKYDISLFSMVRFVLTLTFILILLGNISFWIILKIIKEYFTRKQYLIKNSFIVTYIAIYVLCLQPLMNFYIKSLHCIEIDGRNYLKFSSNIECWSGEHTNLLIRLVLPGLLIIVIPPPLFFFYYISKNKENFHNQMILERVYLVTTGYKNNYYYWEFLLLSMKIILMLISIFLNENPIACVLLMILGLLFLTSLHTIISPYQDQQYNKLAGFNYSAILFSYGCNLFFSYNENVYTNTFLILAMWGFHGIFVVRWTISFYNSVKKFLFLLLRKTSHLIELQKRLFLHNSFRNRKRKVINPINKSSIFISERKLTIKKTNKLELSMVFSKSPLQIDFCLAKNPKVKLRKKRKKEIESKI